MRNPQPSSQSPAIPRVPPPVFFLAALIAMALLHEHLPLTQLLTGQARYAGIAVMVLSLALSASGAMPAGERARHGRPVPLHA